MNTDTIKQLYRLNVELEGILRVLEERDTPHARQLLDEKYRLYHSAMQQLLAEAAPCMNEECCRAEAAGTEETLAAGVSQLLHEAHTVEVKDQEAVEPEVEPELDAAVEAIEHGPQEAVYETEAFVAPEPAPQPVQAPEPAAEAPRMKVDEMIQRRESADLRRAFTLNDKYRFRRELFRNDEQLFADTIDRINRMQTYGQAEALLVGQMGLDDSNDTVLDFLTVVQRHFGV